MQTLWQDLRYGARMLAKKPGFTLVAVLTLALGIGANTAIFSVVNAVLLRSFPYQEPDRVMMVWEKRVRENKNDNVVAPADFTDWKTRQQVFEGMAAQIETTLDLTGDGEPERILAGNVSASFFNVMGVKLALGRDFLPEEEQPGHNQVVILNHSLWQRRFNADPQIIGKKITLSNVPYEVIGVLPPSFWFPNQELALWYPLDFTTQGMRTRTSHFLNVFARLKPGVTLEQARAEMERVGAQLQQEYPEENQYHSAYVIPLREQLVGDVRRALYILLTAVGLVLLIACANVANLLLARAATRQREVAIRTALGASRARLVRQFLTESLLLALLGGGLGTLLALWGVALLTWAMPKDSIPRLTEAGLDGRVLGYTLAISLLTGVLFGLVPALQASKPNLNKTLKEGGRSGELRQRVRGMLVIAEIALALVLLVGAGLMMRSFSKLTDVSPGFEAKNVLTVPLALPDARYRTGAQVRGFYQQLIEKVRALPGVSAVGTTSHLPLSGQDSRIGINIRTRTHSAGAEARALAGDQSRLFQHSENPLAGRPSADGTGHPRGGAAGGITESHAGRTLLATPKSGGQAPAFWRRSGMA